MPTESTGARLPIPTGEDGAWVRQSRLLETFVCDAVFWIAPSFYAGPDNSAPSLEWAIDLPPPNLPRQAPHAVTTEALIGREDELAGHYRRLVAIAETHGKPASLQQPFPYFRTQPAIISGGKVLTAFSWNDSIDETRTVLEALARSAGGGTGVLWDDQDQGWRIVIVAAGAVTCFIEWDGEGAPPDSGGYAVDVASLAQQAGASLERLRTIHGRLVQPLGRDYWSARRPSHGQQASFIRSAAARFRAAFARRPG